MLRALQISTRVPKQIVDITTIISETLRESQNQEGICVLFVQHTTACITTADLDPGTDLDMLDAFSAMMPKLPYRHPHNPIHAPDHILSSIIGPSVSIPVKDGKLVLGTWQRIVLIELDGPRERSVLLSFLAE
jgi:secondary thiamine-phosphate synthase enzyme